MSAPAPGRHPPRFAPKLLTLLRDGYGLSAFRSDALAGLTYAVDRFKNWAHSAHITLRRGERSRLADYASEVL